MITSASTTTASTAATDVIKSLGTGSGIDIKSLAKSLVDAEGAPRKALIDGKVAKSQANISGYAALNYAMSQLQNAFADLKDTSDFAANIATNSQPSAFNVAAGASTRAGNHSVAVSSLATAQRNISTAGYASSNTSLNSGSAITLTLGGTAFSAAPTISVTTDTPAGVVAAINAAGQGLVAQLINTGDTTTPFKIMVTGATGVGKAFTLSSSAPDLDVNTQLQSASNAVLTVNGVAISSASNSVTDAIAGSTLNLLAITNGTPASLNFSNDTSSAKTKLQSLVAAYNDASQLLTEVSDPKSALATYGATLVGNSVVSTIRNQMRGLVTNDSSTTSGNISALRDIGIALNSRGKLEINSVTLDLALKLNYNDTVTMLSGNQQDQGAFDTTVAGVAGDAFKALTTTLSSTGPLKVQSDNATKRIADYQDDLIKLQDRMTMLLARYIKQFSVMDSLVGQSNSLRTSLSSTFTGMQSIYNNK